MKFIKTVKQEVEATLLVASMGVRYWDDGIVNGQEDDEDAPKMPFAKKDGWDISVELATGKIVGWPEGVTAITHYKVCDEGVYTLMNGDGAILQKHGYVPNMLAPSGKGYGDYVILDIGGDGVIAGWKADLSYFGDDE